MGSRWSVWMNHKLLSSPRRSDEPQPRCRNPRRGDSGVPAPPATVSLRRRRRMCAGEFISSSTCTWMLRSSPTPPPSELFMQIKETFL
uniref:Uncharacterized protein n=1 Tax=Oryza barthii TaxID=65489 RepID=A0A0D3EKB6_9ORYZ